MGCRNKLSLPTPPFANRAPAARLQGNVYDATLAVGFQLFSERYLSKITVEPGTKVLVSGKQHWGLVRGA